ncbi:MAG: hypothetical protein LQ338_002752 [Usnochroma carphineum]|nr:MAG: hypothetical protein LQ338_002752 [Usnochroma carphineum]
MSLGDIRRERRGRNPRLAIHDLPNEDVIIRIVHQRLLLAASLEDRKLILECYHPSAQYTEPYVFCDYLGTPGLSSEREGQGSLYQDLRVERGQLKHLYSRFRPSRADFSTNAVRSHPAGDVPASRTSPTDQESASNVGEANRGLVTHRLFLDAHELFTQLSVTAALVQVGPRRGVFLSFIDVIDKKTPRVWREWLAEKANGSTNGETQNREDKVGISASQSEPIIWADSGKTLGLRVRVKENKWRKDAPIIVHRDEDQAISYSLELEELLISTTHLLLAVEKSLLERHGDGKAMIFGSFMPATTSNAAAA